MIFIVIGTFVAVAACWYVLARSTPTTLTSGTGLREADESLNPMITLKKYTMEIL